MTCAETEILLHALLDGELDAGHARDVEAHLEGCPHCGAQFVSRKGSGHRRTYCLRHKAVTCGSDACVRDCVDIYAIEGTLSVREY